ncbi:L-threonine synthase [Carboxydocella thermautotrophica]|nr:L-threonine synthase [Carboxydocella thermautotrophica]
MQYISTRNNFRPISAAEAINLGMVPAGGLFVPESFPQFSREELTELVESSYQELGAAILERYLTDYSREEIRTCLQRAYNAGSFAHPEMAPVVSLAEDIHILELWHGPTAAFKDMALQLLPYLLVTARHKLGASRELVILVATSGDTGKAALEGFKDVPGIRIMVFYPQGGVSQVQERQMLTTGGQNTRVVAVTGNFDDCQNGVKAIFADADLRNYLADRGFELSSANSINWGRLVPQIIYYFSAYLQLVRRGRIVLGDEVNVVVPTGNFGNILAAWYARRMGLPLGKLICASNENNVLTDFFRNGTYDRRRQFKLTNSPSMDILISSNLERFLYDLTGGDGEKITLWFNQLAETGHYTVDEQTRQAIAEVLWAGWCDQEDTLKTIAEVFDRYHYTLDTHTAVAYKVYQDFLQASGDKRPAVIAATASPFKFVSSVLSALVSAGDREGLDEFEQLNMLSRISGLPLHPGLAGLKEKEVRHNWQAGKTELKSQLLCWLGL